MSKQCSNSSRVSEVSGNKVLSPEFNALLTHWVPKEEFEDYLDEIYIILVLFLISII